MKSTAIANSNIALIKYWGKINEKLRLPANSSISMNLDSLWTTTTVEFSKDLKKDRIIINGIDNGDEANRVSKHIDLIRKLAGVTTKARVATKNNFPESVGIASSASGFAALTLAATAAAQIKIAKKELSILARLGSGSASRSIPSGFVEWKKGDSHQNSFAISLFEPNHWKIADIVAIVSDKPKNVGSTAGQKIAKASPFFKIRLKNIDKKINQIKKYIKQKNFARFGELIEAESMELHAIMMTSTPPLIYWHPETLKLMACVKSWRSEGLPIYFTIDAGPNLHLIVEDKNIPALLAKLKNICEVKKTIVNHPGGGARLIDRHLF